MSNKLISKKTLLLYSLPYIQMSLILIGFIVLILGFKLYPEHDQWAMFFVIAGAICVLIGLINLVVRGIDIWFKFNTLRVQEDTLGIQFDLEMQNCKVVDVNSETPDWFIKIHNPKHIVKPLTFVVLRRDYIKRIEDSKTILIPSMSSQKTSFLPPYSGRRTKMNVIMIDGIERNIVNFEKDNTIELFTSWYKRVDDDSKKSLKRNNMT